MRSTLAATCSLSHVISDSSVDLALQLCDPLVLFRCTKDLPKIHDSLLSCAQKWIYSLLASPSGLRLPVCGLRNQPCGSSSSSGFHRSNSLTASSGVAYQ